MPLRFGVPHIPPLTRLGANFAVIGIGEVVVAEWL